MLDGLAKHSSRPVLFARLGFSVLFLLSLPRRLHDLSLIAIATFVGILGAVLITVTEVSIPYQVHSIELFPPRPPFQDAFLAIANIIFAYAGHVAFFIFFSELRDIKDFRKSLALLQINDIALYTIAAVVIYFFADSNVAALELNSASPVVRKIAYSFALPTVRLPFFDSPPA